MLDFSLKKRLREGDRLLGIMLLSGSPVLIEILAHAGFDFVMIDTEHVPFNAASDVVSLTRAAHAAGIPVMVRVRSTDDHTIRSLLEIGVEGLIVPHVQTAEQAQAVVEAARFAPKGHRSYALTVRAGKFGLGIDAGEYIRRTSQDTIIIVMAEDDVFMGNASEIMAVEGVDGVLFGAADYAVAKGLLPHSPEGIAACNAAQKSLADMSNQAGLISAVTVKAMDPKELAPAIEEGHSIVLAGTDLGRFAAMAKETAKEMARLEAEIGR